MRTTAEDVTVRKTGEPWHVEKRSRIPDRMIGETGHHLPPVRAARGI